MIYGQNLSINNNDKEYMKNRMRLYLLKLSGKVKSFFQCLKVTNNTNFNEILKNIYIHANLQRMMMEMNTHWPSYLKELLCQILVA